MEQSIFKLSIEYGAHSMRILENVKKMMALHWDGEKKIPAVQWHWQWNDICPVSLTHFQVSRMTVSSPAPLLGEVHKSLCGRELGHCCPACSRSSPGDVERRNSKGEILSSPISPNMGNSTVTNRTWGGNRRFLCDQVCTNFCSKRQNFQPVWLAHKLVYNYLGLIVTTLRFPTCKFWFLNPSETTAVYFFQ